MARNRFVRRDATKPLAQSSGAFGSIRRPHLQKTIWKSRLENTAGNRCKRHLVSQVGPLPDLLFAPLKGPKRFRFFGAVANTAVGSKNLNPPGVEIGRAHV